MTEIARTVTSVRCHLFRKAGRMSERGMHVSPDGNTWKPATYKRNAVWVRVANAEATVPWMAEGGTTACVKYKSTPKATKYWVAPDLVELKADGAENGGSRRSKRGRGPEAEAEAAAEEEAERKLPRCAANGKLYGVMDGAASRKEFASGKDMKDKCAKCGTSLAGEAHVAFIESTKTKTVKRRYGGEAQKAWKGQFDVQDRDFFLVDCWEVPQVAQKSMRGFIDIDGWDAASEELRERLRKKLPLVRDP